MYRFPWEFGAQQGNALNGATVDTDENNLGERRETELRMESLKLQRVKG